MSAATLADGIPGAVACGDSIELPCPVHDTTITGELQNGVWEFTCLEGCTSEQIAEAIGIHTNGYLPTKSPEQQVIDWKLSLSEYVKIKSRDEEKYHANGVDRATYRQWVYEDVAGLPARMPDKPFLHPPVCLSASETEEELWTVVNAYLPARAGDKAYELGLLNGNGAVVPARSVIIIEDSEQAEVINAEYLSRPAIIDRLGYSQSIALVIGAKHHGKTTVIRSAALSIPRGVDLWGRKTTQGPVIYAASEDEVASTRNELLEMGWRQNKDALHFVRIDPETDATPEQVLDEIANAAVKAKALLVILDMLFDYVPIKDALAYQETRQAIGLVQNLASNTKALVIGTHHTPKYLTEAHEAANAALGSQGVSARFSPIILVRKYTDTLYTIESTTTRDPRGEALKPTRINKNERGWIVLGERFQEWMKWEIYAERVLGLFDGRKGLKVSDVSERLGLDRARVQNTLKQLEAEKKLIREKQGNAYVYFAAGTDMFEREGGNWT